MTLKTYFHFNHNDSTTRNMILISSTINRNGDETWMYQANDLEKDLTCSRTLIEENEDFYNNGNNNIDDDSRWLKCNSQYVDYLMQEDD